MDRGSIAISTTVEQWNDAAESYDMPARYMTYPNAIDAIELADKWLPIDQSTTQVLDNGAGSGALTVELSKKYPRVPILATDISTEMIEALEAAKLPNVDIRLIDALKLGPTLAPDPTYSKYGGFSHVFAMFMIQFVSDPDECLRQMIATTRPGGVICISIWADKLGTVELIFRAFAEFDPTWRDVGAFDNLKPFPRKADPLKEKLEAFGLQDVYAKTKLRRVEREWHDAFIKYAFEGKNPMIVGLFKVWNKSHPEFGPDIIRKRVQQMVDEERDSNPDILSAESLCVLGTKPQPS